MSIDEINELFTNGTITKEDLSSREVFRLIKSVGDWSGYFVEKCEGKDLDYDAKGNVKWFVFRIFHTKRYTVKFKCGSGFLYNPEIEKHKQFKLFLNYLNEWTKGLLSEKGNKKTTGKA